MSTHFTNLAGLSFRPEPSKEVVRNLVVGDSLRLVRDPENPYDSNAVEVWKDAPVEGQEPEFLGFVEKLVNTPIAVALDDASKTVTAVVEKVYDDFATEPSARKGMWAKPYIRITIE